MLSEVIAQAPGRINLIGEHTDYNQGFVLPAAIDKSTRVHLKRNNSNNRCTLMSLNLNRSIELDLNRLQSTSEVWANYLIGVIAELQKLGAVIWGFDCEIKGNIPLGSGLSSSASLECSLAIGLNELFTLNYEKLDLVKAAQMAEHNFVGIKCGIMDQFASIMGKANHVILLDCRSLAYQYIPLALSDHRIILLNTNVTHSLASSEYNTRRAECEAGMVTFQSIYPTVESLRDVTFEMLEKTQDALSVKVYKRCKHVILENDRTLKTVNALESNDLKAVGNYMNQSHDSLSKDYAVSCDELDFLSYWTRNKDYVLGSRMMGGGFGGCTINLVEKKAVDQFLNEISESYLAKFAFDLTSNVVTIEDGAGIVKKLNTKI